jgi:hypothetical protein
VIGAGLEGHGASADACLLGTAADAGQGTWADKGGGGFLKGGGGGGFLTGGAATDAASLAAAQQLSSIDQPSGAALLDAMVRPSFDKPSGSGTRVPSGREGTGLGKAATSSASADAT